MRDTVDSIKEYGVLVPAIVRPCEDGGYEIVSGHRRKYASELAGLETMPVIVRNLDRDAATIVMVDSNLQRENILPRGCLFPHYYFWLKIIRTTRPQNSILILS